MDGTAGGSLGLVNQMQDEPWTLFWGVSVVSNKKAPPFKENRTLFTDWGFLWSVTCLIPTSTVAVQKAR